MKFGKELVKEIILPDLFCRKKKKTIRRNYKTDSFFHSQVPTKQNNCTNRGGELFPAFMRSRFTSGAVNGLK